MQTVRIALIGCGAVTLKAHLPALMNDPTATLSGYQYLIVAAASLDSANLEYIKSILPSVALYSDYHKMLSEVGCDAVLIATGEDIHPIICREALDAGKYVLCEKPLGVSTQQIGDCLSAENSNVVRKLQIAFNKRFYPSYLKFQDHKLRGEIGLPIGGSYQFYTQQGKKSGWQGILSNLIHYCDLITALHGQIIEVKGYQLVNVNGISLSITMISEDESIVSLMFSSAASWNASFHEEWQIVDNARNRFLAKNSNVSALYRHDGYREIQEPSNILYSFSLSSLNCFIPATENPTQEGSLP